MELVAADRAAGVVLLPGPAKLCRASAQTMNVSIGPRKVSHLQTPSDSGSPNTSTPLQPAAEQIGVRRIKIVHFEQWHDAGTLAPAEPEILVARAKQLDLVTVLSRQFHGARRIKGHSQAQDLAEEPDCTGVVLRGDAKPDQTFDPYGIPGSPEVYPSGRRPGRMHSCATMIKNRELAVGPGFLTREADSCSASPATGFPRAARKVIE